MTILFNYDAGIVYSLFGMLYLITALSRDNIFAENMSWRAPLLSRDEISRWEKSLVPGQDQNTELKQHLNAMWRGQHSNCWKSETDSKSDVPYEIPAIDQSKPGYNIYFAWRHAVVWDVPLAGVRHHEVGVQSKSGGPIYWWGMSFDMQHNFLVAVNGKSYEKYRSR